MIKGRSPFPFETIALAVSFSPGLESLVIEMRRLCDQYQSSAVFIHCGKKTSEKHRLLSQILNKFGFHDGNSRIYWESAEAIPALLMICKHEVVDLLLLGLSEKERFDLPAGRFVKEVVKKAKCSLLIYCCDYPEGGFKNIIVAGSEHYKTEASIQTALYMASNENTDHITVLDDSSGIRSDDDLMTYNRIGRAFYRDLISKEQIKIENKSLNGESLVAFAFRENADLFVLNSTDHHLNIFDRVFTDTIDNILQKPPANLLIVHSRIRE